MGQRYESVQSKGWGRCKQNGMEADVQRTDIAGQMYVRIRNLVSFSELVL